MFITTSNILYHSPWRKSGTSISWVQGTHICVENQGTVIHLNWWRYDRRLDHFGVRTYENGHLILPRQRHVNPFWSQILQDVNNIRELRADFSTNGALQWSVFTCVTFTTKRTLLTSFFVPHGLHTLGLKTADNIEFDQLLGLFWTFCKNPQCKPGVEQEITNTLPIHGHNDVMIPHFTANVDDSLDRVIQNVKIVNDQVQLQLHLHPIPSQLGWDSVERRFAIKSCSCLNCFYGQIMLYSCKASHNANALTKGIQKRIHEKLREEVAGQHGWCIMPMTYKCIYRGSSQLVKVFLTNVGCVTTVECKWPDRRLDKQCLFM